jgi:hypothetical protein
MTSTTEWVRDWFRKNGLASMDEVIRGLPMCDPLEVEAVTYALVATAQLGENEDGDFYPWSPSPFPPEDMEIIRAEGFPPGFIRLFCDRHGCDLYEAMERNQKYRSFINQKWQGE